MSYYYGDDAYKGHFRRHPWERDPDDPPPREFEVDLRRSAKDDNVLSFAVYVRGNPGDWVTLELRTAERREVEIPPRRVVRTGKSRWRVRVPAEMAEYRLTLWAGRPGRGIEKRHSTGWQPLNAFRPYANETRRATESWTEDGALE